MSIFFIMVEKWGEVCKTDDRRHLTGELKSSSLCLYSSNLSPFWLKIEQLWPFGEISIFSNGSDFPTAYLGPNIDPSPNVKKALFFPISWGKFPIAW